MTYSPLLLATDAGLAAAKAVLFSLTGTTLQREDGEELQHVRRVSWISILRPDIHKGASPCGGVLTFSISVQTLLLHKKNWNGPVRRRKGQSHTKSGREEINLGVILSYIKVPISSSRGRCSNIKLQNINSRILCVILRWINFTVVVWALKLL